MGREYEPTGLTLVHMSDGDYCSEFTVAVGSDEGIVQGETTFDGSTRIQRWVVSAGPGGTIPCMSAPYVRQDGETAVQVQVFKDGGKVGSDTTNYPD